MLEIHKSYPLKNNTSFGIDIACEWFAEPKSTEELDQIIQYAKENSLISTVIGEGSNLLFVQHYNGLIIHPSIKGKEKVDETNSEVFIRVGAGENWDKFVAYCVYNNWYGAENLSLIPGSVGASPVQNIGAYGVEAKDIIEEVEVYDTETGNIKSFSNSECKFAYRDSIFKQHLKDRYIVSQVIFRLRKSGELNLNYGNVNEVFRKAENQNLEGLRSSIISIRESKLPDPSIYGNAGSFFKNPVISQTKYQSLKSVFGEVPGFPDHMQRIKLPAAWLIEQANMKGVREGNIGTWPQQPLVLVNYGGATGLEIFNFSEKIRKAVFSIFGIDLEREVTII